MIIFYVMEDVNAEGVVKSKPVMNHWMKRCRSIYVCPIIRKKVLGIQNTETMQESMDSSDVKTE